MNTKQLQQNLIQALGVDGAVVSRAAYFAALARWVTSARSSLGEPVVRLYGLDWMAEEDPSKFALDRSEIQPVEEVSSLRRVEFSGSDSIVAWVRDQMWGLIAYKTDELCHVCGGDAMRALVVDSGASRVPILACDLCGASKIVGDHGVPDGTPARPATKTDLEAWGLLSVD